MTELGREILDAKTVEQLKRIWDQHKADPAVRRTIKKRLEEIREFDAKAIPATGSK